MAAIITFMKTELDKICEYRFMQCDEFKALDERFKDKSSLEKVVWGEKKML